MADRPSGNGYTVLLHRLGLPRSHRLLLWARNIERAHHCAGDCISGNAISRPDRRGYDSVADAGTRSSQVQR